MPLVKKRLTMQMMNAIKAFFPMKQISKLRIFHDL